MEIKDVSQDIENEMKNGVKRLLSIDAEIKGLQNEKKDIKAELKASGVDLKLTSKIITLLKRKKKESDDPIFAEAYTFAEKFYEDDDIGTIMENF